MRFPAVCLSLFSVIAVAAAGTPREDALDSLLSERDSEQALAAVIEKARKVGVSEQAVLEARFLYHIDRREDDAFIKQRELFKIQDSAIFGMKEDWLAVIEYVQAIAALKKGDKDSFKSHITEAFWLSPRQASAFAPHIDRLRLEEAMQAVKIDFETKLVALGGGDAIVLKNLIVDKKAMLLHFWSPASKECEASLPDFLITAKALGDKGVVMVSLLPEDSPKILTIAREMILPLGINPPGAWLIDHKESPLAGLLRVQTLPVFVLISNDGRVLFNGDPADDGLWDALKKIDPQIIRPEAGDAME
jgi:hypothetical protein